MYQGREPTFLRMYVLLDPRSFSISLAKSRDISSEAMFAKVHNARPTAYMLEWFISLSTEGNQLVIVVPRASHELFQ